MPKTHLIKLALMVFRLNTTYRHRHSVNGTTHIFVPSILVALLLRFDKPYCEGLDFDSGKVLYMNVMPLSG